ncbi:MAG: GH25 family lysozyme [Lachnospiraceae bacterium]
MKQQGIDVSHHQGTIDWTKVKQDGVEFAMIRAGYGKNNTDRYWERNAAGCQGQNIALGVYWFSYAYTTQMARQEARYCIEKAAKWKVSYPLCFDLEYDTIRFARENGVTIGRELATEMVRAFCEEVQANGYIPMYYSNLDYLNRMFDRLPYSLWYARYTQQPMRDDMAIWQYTAQGRVNGIQGNVDRDISYRDFHETDLPENNPGGDWILRLQKELKKQGYDPGPIDGIAGPRTAAACPLLREGARGNITRLVQERLGNDFRIGVTGGYDGIFGNGTKRAVMELQKQYRLVIDGIVGKRTWKVLLGLL